ncbi:MAG: glutamate--tRNA ligase family protein [Nanoarchaeota archaeon]
MDEIIKYLVFKGYFEYKEKFKPNSIIGKLILINPEIKKEIRNLMPKINEFLEEVKRLSEEEIIKFLESNKYIEEKFKAINKKKEKDDLPELNLEILKNPWFDGFKTRFEPSPSGPLHIGHAIGVVVNWLYSKKYDGEFVLRLADTNPKNIMVEAYDYIVEDVEYLTGERKEPVIQSKRIKIYYEKVEELLKKGLAYIALYDKKEKEYFQIGNFKLDKTILQRDRAIEENLELWEKMLNNEFKEGEAIVRIKTTKSKNPTEPLEETIKYFKNSSLIDFPIFRIVEEEHPLMNNIFVWPLMNFSVAIDDWLLKISHVIRGKDHELNGEKQKIIYNYFDAPIPEFIYFGRINFVDLKVSTTQTKKAIIEGKFEGWDDLRLPFIKALKRRGIQREAIIKYVKKFGTSKSDKKTTIEEFFKTLYKFNREILDPKVNRYFLVENPYLLKIEGLKKEIKLKLRPNSSEERTIIVDEKVFVDKNNIEELLNKGINKVRLMHLATIEIFKENDKIKAKYIGDEIVKNKIHWVSKLNSEEIALLKVKGLELIKKPVIIEKEALLEDIFQAERIGFIKNEKEKEQLIFMHN